MAVAPRPAAPTTLSGQASARAAADVAAVVAGLQAQQTASLQQASLRAQQQGALGIAASKYLEGLDLGGRTASDFSNAAAAQVAAAQGFQGGLQQTVGDAAQAVQHNLDVMGGGQTATNQSQAAGNALYALGGYLPSAQLGVVGPALAAGQRALPAQTLGFGQMLAQGELGAGQQEAAKYGADISAAYAKQPTLTATYLDALNEAAAVAAKARQDAAFKQATLDQNARIAQSRVDIANQKASAPHFFSAGGVGYAWDPSTGSVRQVTKDAAATTAASLPKYRQFGDTLYEVTPNGLSAVATKPADAPHLTTFSDSTGTYTFDPATGAKGARIGGPPASAVPKPPSPQIVGTDATGRSVWTPGISGKPGTLTPLKGILGKPVGTKGGAKPKPYKVPAGADTLAQQMAGSTGSVNPVLGALGATTGGAPVTAAKPWPEALRRMVAYLAAHGAPKAQRKALATQVLIANGFMPPATPVNNASLAPPGQAFGQTALSPVYNFGQ